MTSFEVYKEAALSHPPTRINRNKKLFIASVSSSISARTNIDMVLLSTFKLIMKAPAKPISMYLSCSKISATKLIIADTKLLMSPEQASL